AAAGPRAAAARTPRGRRVDATPVRPGVERVAHPRVRGLRDVAREPPVRVAHEVSSTVVVGRRTDPSSRVAAGARTCTAGAAGWLQVAARRASVAAEVVTVPDVFPRVAQVVLDTTDARALAEFYPPLPGLEYRAGDEPPSPGDPDPAGQDWLVLPGGPGGIPPASPQAGSLPPPK